jgi:hypothetical protein
VPARAGTIGAVPTPSPRQEDPMDPRLNHLLIAGETERRIAAARTPRAPRSHRPWPSGRTVDPAIFGRRFGLTRWY